MTKLFIATPAYDGKVHAEYAIALAETLTRLNSQGIAVEFQINCSGSLLAAERNRIVKAFMESDCTHILMIDSDLAWQAMAVIGMILKDVDFVAGVYPARKDNAFLFRPALREDGAIIANNEKMLLKMDYIPAGFMMIKKSAMQKIIDAHPETAFVPKDTALPSGHALFNTEVFEGEFWGEDYFFCRKAREAGIDIWVDPNLQFNHAGVIGCMASVLSDKKPE